MTETASLVIKVDSRGAKSATGDLDKLTAAGDRSERAAALGLAVLFAVGAAGHVMAPTLPWMLRTTPGFLLATAVLISVLGSAMIPYAIRSVGATVTGIMGVLEPVTSVILGVLILSEPIGLRNAIGATLVLSAAVMQELKKEEEL